MDPQGRLVSYNLDAESGVKPQRVCRPWQLHAGPDRAAQLILRYMPLKADRALPGDLLKCMRECGWLGVSQVPRVFRQAMIPQPAMRVAVTVGPPVSAVKTTEEKQEEEKMQQQETSAQSPEKREEPGPKSSEEEHDVPAARSTSRSSGSSARPPSD